MQKVLLLITFYSLAVALTRLEPPGYECGENYIILEETGGNFWINGSTSWNNRSQWGGISCDLNCNITSLVIRGNNLTGTVPKSLSGLIKIQEIYFSYNHLISGLQVVGQFPHLINIFMQHNNIYEPLPDILSDLVTGIDLFNNSIYGNLRSEYSTLSGTIPEEGKNLTRLI